MGTSLIISSVKLLTEGTLMSLLHCSDASIQDASTKYYIYSITQHSNVLTYFEPLINYHSISLLQLIFRMLLQFLNCHWL